MKTLYLTDRPAWRAWLAEHYNQESEIWLVYYKTHTGQPSILYEDAVEEALCFGWIDSLIKKLDDERYARKFTPRNPGSNWSVPNKRRVLKVIREGRMTSIGMAKVDFPLDEPITDRPKPPADAETGLDKPLVELLKSNPLAWENFNQLAPSQRRNYIGWIMSAKRDETRVRRMRQAIERLKRGQALGMK